jgi:hypothetical protein
MRAEDAVGLSFFLVLFVGVGTILSALRRPEGSRERSLRQGAGSVVMGFAITAFGALTFTLIRTSPRTVVEGNIWAVVNGSDSSSFRVTDDSGHVAMVRCRYDGSGLRERERARVRYVEYNRKLIEMTMLSGPSTGWRIEESSGEWGWLVWVGLGFVCGVAGWRQRRSAAVGAA